MLIRNLEFFEQANSASDVQGGASVEGFAAADSFRGGGISAAVADADVESKGNLNSFGRTGTSANVAPNYAVSTAYFAGSAVDKNGKYAVKYGVDYSLS